MTKLLPLALALAATAAHAQVRLPGDAPSALLAQAPRLLTDAVLTAPDADVRQVMDLSYGKHLTLTSMVGMASSVTGVLLAAGLGSLSNNLIVTAILTLLPNLVLPPLVTVLFAQFIGNWDSPGRFGFWLPFAGAFVVNAAAYVLASLVMVVPWTSPLALLLYTVVDGVLMGGSTVGLMHLTQKKKPVVTTLPSFVPGVSDTTLVGLMKVNL